MDLIHARVSLVSNGTTTISVVLLCAQGTTYRARATASTLALASQVMLGTPFPILVHRAFLAADNIRQVLLLEEPVSVFPNLFGIRIHKGVKLTAQEHI
jgi:hypothetical protein